MTASFEQIIIEIRTHKIHTSYDPERHAMRGNRWFRGSWEADDDISPQQTEHATKLRIPFLTSRHPHRYYVTGIVVGSDPWGGEVPTDEEVAQVAVARNSYMDYFYPEPNAFRAEMEAYAPYDLDNGANAFYFLKRSDGGWAYSRNSWSLPVWGPSLIEPPVTLAEVIKLGSLIWERPRHR